MKLTRTLAISLAAFACVSAQAVTLAVWNFNDTTSTNTLLGVSRQEAGVNASLTTNFEAANVVNFSGSALGADSGDAAGQALALQGGANLANNGRTVVLQFDASLFESLTLSYATRNTSTGFNNQEVAISTDGSNYSVIGNVNDMTTSFALKSFDISALDGESTAYVRYTFTGATNENGNNRLDNIVIGGEAVPEPATMTLLGLGVAALAARKRKKA